MAISNAPKYVLSYARYMSTAIPNRLEDKVAVVTGSSEGIGLAIVKRFIDEGAKVVISGRRQSKVNEALKILQAGKRVLGTACHVGKINQRIRMLEMANYGLGGIDILVVNAGISPQMHDVLDTTERTWNKILDINVKSSYRLAKESAPYMLKRAKGKIIFNSSIQGYQPLSILGAYSVSKAALISLTRATAVQLAKYDINVNSVAPGIIQTKFSQVIRHNEKDELLSQIPMGRFGYPEEVASAVAFLASDDADYITGETICITGGMVSRL